MLIGTLARETGTPVSTLRFYERTGLLGEPPRTSGQRRYPPEAAERVAMIRMWRRAGFSVTEIRTLLADRHRLEDWQSLVRTKIAELGTQLAEIERSRNELNHALLCRAGDWTTCGWMKAAAGSTGSPRRDMPPA
jgi:DNA-binding transcriptional MerR regulator